jgi:hypothetical protein
MFPPLFNYVGLAGSAGMASALMIGIGIVPTIFLNGRAEH